MGEAPLALRQIAADLAAAGIDVLPWEALTIRQLSLAFVGERHVAEKPDCPAPFDGTDRTREQARRDDIAAKVEAAFRHLAAQQAANAPAPPKPPVRNRKRKE